MTTKKCCTAAAVLAAFCILSGCGGREAGGTDSARIAQTWSTMEDFTASVRLLAEDGTSLYEYAGDYSFDADGADTLVLTAPESLAGLTLSVAGEGGALTVQYADAVFDTGVPARAGATAADGVPGLLGCLREDEAVETWEEEVGGVRMLAARYETEDDDGTITRQVWLTPDSLRPACAEIYADGTRVLQLFFSQVR